MIEDSLCATVIVVRFEALGIGVRVRVRVGVGVRDDKRGGGK
jgi:hypothetical protein